MELSISNLIKIIIGVLVVAVVSYGLYYFFSNNVIDLFGNVGVNSTGKFFLRLFL